MQRYDSYKPSGIQWVKKIPSHWGVERAKWLFDRMERPVRPEDDVVTAFRDGQVTLRTNRRIEGFTNALQEHGYQGIRKGDLVIHAMDAFAGAIGVSDSDGKSTPVYAACVPRGEHPVNSYYYAYLLRYMAHSGYIQSLSKGIRERSTDFRFGEFRELPLPIPDKDEQDRIVAFLDQKTTEIDAAIAKKERLIELLQKQKNIRVHQAVLHGLNPDVPLRDSGVSWIGAIPAHWQVVPNRYIFREQNARSLRGEETHLSMSQRYGLVPAKELDVQTLQSESYDGAKLCEKGDLVQNRLKAHLAVFAVAPCDGLVSPDYSVFRLQSPENQPVYFERLFKTPNYLGELNRRVRGIVVGFLRLYSEDFNAIPALVPPFDEQAEIVRFIETTNKDFEDVRAKIDAEIAMLRELKAITVASAVTGKIKV
ncbi:restriction endonuclease subunit S [Paraburkholderia denitrificans]|uniref:Restriction endonuclease subunit S n=1 Tax=Paraburkholderia denitrificans TaxID=694025 RepID=A0ABW0JFF6_9BURK